MSAASQSRTARGGGRWFPGDRKTLQADVDRYLSQADVPKEVVEVSKPILGVVSPHAGLQFSGPVAAYSFRALRDNATHTVAPEVVVIIGLVLCVL